ncbi:MAG TPA: hypothetical protein VMM56_12070, partial [Planctomycetaceae bacterium]|nr:hypothetical protein [Planctomycetaceae bacterium]
PSPMNIKSALMQFLHATPGERTRARLLMMKVIQHQVTIADAVQNGAAHAYAPELLTLHHFRFFREGRYPSWLSVSNYKGRYDSLWNKTETTPVWKCDQIATRIPQRGGYVLVQELEFIGARRTIFLQLAAEWTRLKTGKLPTNVRDLIEESAGQSLTDSDPNAVSIYETGIESHPILNLAEQYEASQMSADSYKRSLGRPILVDPVTNRSFELDFTQGISEATP